MSQNTETSFMGPALFVGLTLYMLATGEPAEQEINPQRAMKLLEAQTEQTLIAEQIAPINPPQALAPQPRLQAGAIVPFPVDEARLTVPRPAPRAAIFWRNRPLPTPMDDQRTTPMVSTEAALSRTIAPAPLPAPAAAPRPVARPAFPEVTISADAVHLRDAPSARSPIGARLDAGTRAELLGTSGNWSRILLPDLAPPLTGWIYTDYIEAADAGENSDN